MGDRANIFIQTEMQDDGQWAGIGVYTHWRGEGIHAAALAALPKAAGRVGDTSYFARIIVHNVLNAVADPDSETGAGLWTVFPDDNDGYPVLVINAQTGKHWFTPLGNHASDQKED